MIKNENGRSMVEMLGVLAIIGVLSIGGIAGYTMAMNKYRANENLATGSQCVILAQSDKGGEGIEEGSSNKVNCKDEYDLNVRDGVTMTVERTDDNEYTLHVNDTEDVCKQMNNAFPSDSDPYELDCS